MGKDGSLGQHCYLCDMPKLEWQLPQHEKGNLWSLDRIKETSASLDASTKCIRGVVGKPLIDCVNID